MNVVSFDQRSPHRKLLDEQIAQESPLPPLELPTDAMPLPLEERLGRLAQRPQALLGIVENGRIRLLDAEVRLPERSRVIVVTSGTV